MRADYDHLYTSLLRRFAATVSAFLGRVAMGLVIGGIALLPTFVDGVAGTPAALAAEATVDLGTAAPFSVLAGAGVTNTGPTVLAGDLGTCPTPAITGFPPGLVNGQQHANDEVACQAQSDLTIAYDSAAGRASTTTYPGPTDLGGATLLTGVYTSPVSLAITGTLTLDAKQVPDAAFIFQAGSTLITATDSRVSLINGAQACNVFWQVGSSSTLGVDSTFAGTVMALASITGNHKATVDGRLLARNGAVTLDSNTVTAAPCATGASSSSPPSSTNPTTTNPPTSSSPNASTSSTGSSSTTSTQPGSTAGTEQGASTSNGSGSTAATTDAAATSGPAAEVLGDAGERTGVNGAAPVTTLPRTGSPIGPILLVASIALLLGRVALRFGRVRRG